MTTSEWHVDADLWAAYAAGNLDPVTESSVDAHAVHCSRCRQAAARAVPAAGLELAWDQVAAVMQTPRPTRVHRLLRRLGVPEGDAVLLGAEGLAVPWSISVGGALACAMVSGVMPRYQDTSFLLLAPLVPVLAVIALYDASEPLRELIAGTPYRRLRLALLRTTAALAVALPVTVAVGMLVPGLEDLAFVWLLPGLALASSALVLLTWLSPWPAGGLVCGTWLVVVLGLGSSEVGVLTEAVAQVGFAALAALMVAVLVLRSSTVRLLGGSS